MNQIQFFINAIALCIILLYTTLNIKESLYTVLVMAIPINVVCLMLFMYIYFTEAKEQYDDQEFLVLSIVEENRFNHKAYSTLSINEGRYVTFFVWGANISVREDENVF